MDISQFIDGQTHTYRLYWKPRQPYSRPELLYTSRSLSDVVRYQQRWRSEQGPLVTDDSDYFVSMDQHAPHGGSYDLSMIEAVFLAPILRRAELRLPASRRRGGAIGGR
jgi:hypothetical protein